MKAGIYRHWKGPLYLVLGTAHDANADTLIVKCDDHGQTVMGEREVVVYVPLMLDGAHFGPRMAVRTRDNFEDGLCTTPECPYFERVLPDGNPSDPTLDEADTRCRWRHTRPRFAFLGEHYTPEMTP